MGKMFKAYPFASEDVKSIGQALQELPDFMNRIKRLVNEWSVSSDVDRIIVNADCGNTLFPYGGAGGSTADMFWATSTTANEISVSAGVCVVGLTKYDVDALVDEAVADDEWLVLKIDMRDPTEDPVYEAVTNPYPISTETYFKYIKIARFDGSTFQRAWKGGLLEVDYT